MRWWHSNWRAGKRRPASTLKRRAGIRPRPNDFAGRNGRAKPRRHWRAYALRRQPPQSRSNRAKHPRVLPKEQFQYLPPWLHLGHAAPTPRREGKAPIGPKHKGYPQASLTSKTRLRLGMNRIKPVQAVRTSKLLAKGSKTSQFAKDPADGAAGAVETGVAPTRGALPGRRSQLPACKRKTARSHRLVRNSSEVLRYLHRLFPT